MHFECCKCSDNKSNWPKKDAYQKETKEKQKSFFCTSDDRIHSWCFTRSEYFVFLVDKLLIYLSSYIDTETIRWLWKSNIAMNHLFYFCFRNLVLGAIYKIIGLTRNSSKICHPIFFFVNQSKPENRLNFVW